MECGMERRFHRGFTAAEKTAARSTRRASGRTGASRLELLPPPRSSIPLEAVLSSKAASFPFSRGQIQAKIGGTVPVPGAASSLYEGRLDGPLAGRVGVLGQSSYFSS
jgi:hypothetical protein